MIPAWLVLLGTLVVAVDAIAVAVFVVRWERRTPARQVGEAGPGAAEHSAAPHPSTVEQAEARADALSS